MSTSILKQVKASAGSGKTYALTERFLELLGGAGREDTGMVCAGASSRRFNWPEILAATFTNKAAAEMKERVIKALKLCALDIVGQGQKADWEPERAAALLERILLNFHRLNIRTIDSLLNMLLRLFALELGLSPDFELTFENRDIMEPVLDRFMERCEAGDPKALEVFDGLLQTMIEHEQRQGFWLSDGVRERMTELMGHMGTHELELDQRAIADALLPHHARYAGLVRDMLGRLTDEGLAVNANFKKFLEHDLGVQLFDGPKDSKMIAKDSLSDCLNAKSKEAQSPEADSLYVQLQKAHEDYARTCAVLKGAYTLAPSLSLARELAGTILRTQQERGRFLSSLLPDTVADLLGDGQAVPEAYCRIGGRLHHMLVDEFQDTSRPQWQAMTPLARECLSKGGGVFYVGDVKQAIYGWRGGDSDLFDEVSGQPELAAAAEEVTAQTLPNNWRSSPQVVEFNNDFFARLEDPDVLWDLADALLADADGPTQQDFVDRVHRAFKDSSQLVPSKNAALPGHVRLTALPGKGDDLQEATLAAFDQLMDELRERRSLSDIAVLVRSGTDATTICDRLVERGIPVITENSLRLASHPVVRQMAAIMAFADTPMDEPAFLEVITGSELFLAESGLTGAQVDGWLVSRPKRPLWRSFSEAFPDQWRICLEPFFSRASVLGPYDMASEILQGFRVLERHPEAELYVRRFLELIHGAEEQGKGSLSTFLEFWNEQAGEEKVPLPEHVDAVSIMTIHKSKGLEFPVVIVPFHDWKLHTQGQFIDVELDGVTYLTTLKKAIGRRYFEKIGADIRESLNLLYVAWTRAREELHGFYGDSATSSQPVQTLLCSAFDGEEVVERGAAPTQPDPGEHAEAENRTDSAKNQPSPDQQNKCAPPTYADSQNTGTEEEQVLPPSQPCAAMSPRTDSAEMSVTSDMPCRTDNAGVDPGSALAPSNGSAPDSPLDATPSADATALPPRTAPHEMLSWLPRLRVYRHALEDARFDSRMRGKVAHKAFELYTHSGDRDTDASRAVQYALRAFPAARPFREALELEVPQMLHWALSQPQLAPAMERGRPEAGILDTEGNAHRPDRMLIENGMATVLEFKTGQPSTEHATQTRRYLNLLRELECGPDGQPVSDAVGLIVYLDGQTVQEVR